jgi:hypothetical protein
VKNRFQNVPFKCNLFRYTWKLDVPMTVPGGAAQWSPVLWLEPPLRGEGRRGSQRLLLFYTQSSKRECVRPASGRAALSPGCQITLHGPCRLS